MKYLYLFAALILFLLSTPAIPGLIVACRYSVFDLKNFNMSWHLRWLMLLAFSKSSPFYYSLTATYLCLDKFANKK